jgi:hypothetical protein
MQRYFIIFMLVVIAAILLPTLVKGFIRRFLRR